MADYRLSDKLRTDVVTSVVETGKIAEYTERLSEFDVKDSQPWCSSMLTLIFDSFGNQSFISTDSKIRAGERIIRRYSSLTVCQFARFINQWEAGEYGHQPPTLPHIMEELKLYYLKNVEHKDVDEDYDWKERETLIDHLAEDREWLYGRYNAEDIRHEANMAYMRFVNSEHTADDLYLLANYANGVIPAKSWNFLIFNYGAWRAMKRRHLPEFPKAPVQIKKTEGNTELKNLIKNAIS